MRVVIMGCGRVGSQLATQLFREGHEVGIIDMSQKSFRRVPDDFHGLAVVGTGIDEDVLRAAGIEGADAFVAVTEGDNRNIMAAQVAREIFGVPEVVARIYDPGREAIYRDLGIDSICPTTVVCELVRERLESKVVRRT